MRYHLRWAAEGAEDGRKSKTFKAEPLAEVIAGWHEDRAESSRPINVQDLGRVLSSWDTTKTWRPLTKGVICDPNDRLCHSEEAEEAKKKLEGAGASVEIK